MMGTRFLFLMVTAAWSALLVPQAPAAPVDRVTAWREDLAFFAREFPAAQKDFVKLYPRPQFDEALGALTSNLGAATDSEIVLGLMRLVASAHVGHTAVRLPLDGPLAFHRLPIGLEWFSDGLAVSAAAAAYREALGLRITAIGALSPEALEATIAPYIAYERVASLRAETQSFMLVEEVLRAAGQVDADGRVALTLARSDGTTFTMRVAPIAWTDRTPLIYLVTARNLPLGPARVEPARYYRYEILPGTKTLYVRYSKCADDPRQPFAAFVRDVFAQVDANSEAVDRVIVDLRANGGGNSRVINPLLDGLRARKALAARGHLFVLTGPATFSSGLLAAYALKSMNAILVGEPPGENLNSYSEVKVLTLPHSRILIQYSTKYNKLGKDGETLQPDVPVTRSIGDWLAGRDPVLERAAR